MGFKPFPYSFAMSSELTMRDNRPSLNLRHGPPPSLTTRRHCLLLLPPPQPLFRRANPRGDPPAPHCKPTTHPPTLTMDWQPQDEQLRQLAQCLKDSLSGQDQTAMKNAEIVSQSPPPHSAPLC